MDNPARDEDWRTVADRQRDGVGRPSVELEDAPARAHEDRAAEGVVLEVVDLDLRFAPRSATICPRAPMGLR
jgi:hypothetical protein